jgi:ribosomal protein S18 acetylase RimI-like enzyme
LNFTREVQQILRKAPKALSANDDFSIAVAVHNHENIVGVVLYQGVLTDDSIDSVRRPHIVALGVSPSFRRLGIASMLKLLAIIDMKESGYIGPTISFVNQRNQPMMKLNETRFLAAYEPDPDHPGDYLVTADVDHEQAGEEN